MSVINMFPFSTKEVLQRCPALSFQNYRTGLLSHLEKEQAGVLKVDFISSKKKKIGIFGMVIYSLNCLLTASECEGQS